MLERLGALLFRIALSILPGPMRRRWGREMRQHFRERQRSFRRRWTAAGLPAFWVREAAGLLRAAWRARRPDAWARRTEPDRGGPAGRRTAPPPARPPAASPGPVPSHEPATLGTRMDQLRQDLRFALRSFLRRPGMTALAVGSLALGIGASTAMFSVVDSVLLRPLPFDDPGALVHVYPRNPELADHPTLAGAALRGTFSAPEFYWVAERQRVFERVGAFYAWGGATLSGEDGRPERLRLVRATEGLLPALGVEAVRGRILGSGDDPRDGAGRSCSPRRSGATGSRATPTSSAASSVWTTSRTRWSGSSRGRSGW